MGERKALSRLAERPGESVVWVRAERLSERESTGRFRGRRERKRRISALRERRLWWRWEAEAASGLAERSGVSERWQTGWLREGEGWEASWLGEAFGESEG